MSDRRILHLVHSLGRGGAETQLAYLSGGLIGLGWEVHVGYLGWGIGEETNIRRLNDAGSRLYRLRHYSNYDPTDILRLLNLIRRVNPSIVQTWLPYLDIVGGIATRLAGVPWVLTERNTPEFLGRGPKMLLRGWIGRRANAFVSNSPSGDEYWADRIGADAQHRVIRNALPLDELAAVVRANRSAQGVPSDQKLVLFAGRLEPQKNIHILLEALRIVLQRENAVAMICGRGPLDSFVDSFVRKWGLAGRIIFPGFLPDLWSWIRAADVFVSVSRFEGMPNAVMEAVALECPTVLSDIPTHRAILDEDSALFAPPDDPNAIADAIGSAIRDPERAMGRAKAGKKAAQEWSVGNAARAYAAVYEDVIAALDVRRLSAG